MTGSDMCIQGGQTQGLSLRPIRQNRLDRALDGEEQSGRGMLTASLAPAGTLYMISPSVPLVPPTMG